MQKLEGLREQPDADPNRIDRIEHNLEVTLGLCTRAIEAIQQIGDMHIHPPHTKHQKFVGMDPITEAKISEVDLDDLIKKLQP